jgi:hypothetical protein
MFLQRVFIDTFALLQWNTLMSRSQTPPHPVMRFLTQYLNVTVPTITPQSLLRVNGLTFVSITPPLRSLFFLLFLAHTPFCLFVVNTSLLSLVVPDGELDSFTRLSQLSLERKNYFETQVRVTKAGALPTSKFLIFRQYMCMTMWHKFITIANTLLRNSVHYHLTPSTAWV